MGFSFNFFFFEANFLFFNLFFHNLSFSYPVSFFFLIFRLKMDSFKKIILFNVWRAKLSKIVSF